jgi:hypothetical protein
MKDETLPIVPSSPMPTASSIAEYEAWAVTQEQKPVGLREWFPDGLYVREITVEAGEFGTQITGAEHTTEYFSFMSEGVVSVWDALLGQGSAALLVAPLRFIIPPGSRKIGVVHETMVWTDVFPNPDNCKDGETVMARHVKFPPAYFQLKAAGKLPCLRS